MDHAVVAHPHAHPHGEAAMIVNEFNDHDSLPDWALTERLTLFCKRIKGIVDALRIHDILIG